MVRRVGEILDSSDVSYWNWILTLDNVADEEDRDGKEIDFHQAVVVSIVLHFFSSLRPIENSKKKRLKQNK